MKIPIYQVDAFTNHPFGGNPAAVCILSGPADETWMQKVANEMNLSETAFLYPEGECLDGECYRLRWFAPKAEVKLCGHATLASAHVLWESRRLAEGAAVQFYTLSGVLSARKVNQDIELDFPATVVEMIDPPQGLIDALRATPKFVGKSEFDYFVEVESAEVVRKLDPDFGRLARLPVRGVIVTAVSDQTEYDFISRFFAPAVGVNEDPVTGSAHCALGPYWQGRLAKSTFAAYQASARGGVLGVAVEGERVKLLGRAVTILRGELL